MELKPYRPGFTRIDPHRNPCQFLRIPWLRYGEKTFLARVQKFLQGFQFHINIRIEPVRTAPTRFNPQRKTASTLAAYHMTFKVTIRIWSGWKWAKWVMIYATVTHSWISNRVHTELKPYRPGSTRIEPGPYWIKTVSTRFHPFRPGSIRIVTRVNSWGFWGLRYGGENILVMFKIFVHLKPCINQF
jgi:hypothetical protein